MAKIQNAKAAGVLNSKPSALVAQFWSDLTSNDSTSLTLAISSCSS